MPEVNINGSVRPFGHTVNFSEFGYEDTNLASWSVHMEDCKPGPHYLEVMDGERVLGTSKASYPSNGFISQFVFSPPLPIKGGSALMFRYFRMDRVDLTLTVVPHA